MRVVLLHANDVVEPYEVPTLEPTLTFPWCEHISERSFIMREDTYSLVGITPEGIAVYQEEE